MKINYKLDYKDAIGIFVILSMFCISIKFFANYTTSKNLPVTVLVTAKIEQDDTYQLFYTKADSNNSFTETDSIKKEVKKQDGFQTIKFDLPDTNIKSLRLDPGSKPGDIVIKDIKLKNIVHTYVFYPENIINQFKSNNNIKKFEVKEGLAYISSNGNDPYIINSDVTYVLQLLNSKKIVFGKKILAVLLCLAFSTILTFVLKKTLMLIINYKKMISKINEVTNNFLKYKHLLWELVIRDIKVKYKKSYLGILWSVLNPLLMMVVIDIVFSNLFRFSIPNYPIYLLTGQTAFNFFSEATNMGMSSIINNSSLIKKVYIPKYIFTTARVLSSFVNLLFSLAAILIMLVITKTKLTWTILLFPIPLLYLLLFSMGIGLILAAYAVFFRDLIHLYGVLLTAWMYITPIFYPANIIPKEYQVLLELNPLYYMVEYFRDVVLYSKVPALSLNLTCILISLSALIVGLYAFYRNQNKFILYI